MLWQMILSPYDMVVTFPAESSRLKRPLNNRTASSSDLALWFWRVEGSYNSERRCFPQCARGSRRYYRHTQWYQPGLR